MEIKEYFSPNFNKKKRPKKSIKIIVIHYTGMQSERESLRRLCDAKSKVSSHYLINRKGRICRLVKEKNIAWHAGKSCWRNYKNINNYSIGIELVNKGHEFGYTNFSKKQILKLTFLCKKIIKKYNISKNNIVGHSDIAPLRKTDPGEKFPWEVLAKNNIGMWHSLKFALLKKLRKKKTKLPKDKIEFIKHLNKIGYCLNLHTKKSLYIRVIKAFQRHYRKELINGMLDEECLKIASNLVKNAKNT